MSDLLEEMDDEDKAWRVVLLVALAQAEDDASQYAAAARRVTRALEMSQALDARASSELGAAEAAAEAAEADLAWAERLVRAAEEGKPVPPRPINGRRDEEEGLEEKAVSGEEEVQEEGPQVPDMAAAAAALSAAEAAMSATTLSVEKARTLAATEARRLESTALLAVHLGRQSGPEFAAVRQPTVLDSLTAELPPRVSFSLGSRALRVCRLSFWPRHRSRVLSHPPTGVAPCSSCSARVRDLSWERPPRRSLKRRFKHSSPP